MSKRYHAIGFYNYKGTDRGSICFASLDGKIFCETDEVMTPEAWRIVEESLEGADKIDSWWRGGFYFDGCTIEDEYGAEVKEVEV